MERHGFSQEAQQALKDAYKILYRSKLNLHQALERMEAELPEIPEILHLAGFLRGSTRGITL
jgi:UDP-N-acetylglucosamine acyltransferase